MQKVGPNHVFLGKAILKAKPDATAIPFALILFTVDGVSGQPPVFMWALRTAPWETPGSVCSCGFERKPSFQWASQQLNPIQQSERSIPTAAPLFSLWFPSSKGGRALKPCEERESPWGSDGDLESLPPGTWPGTRGVCLGAGPGT